MRAVSIEARSFRTLTEVRAEIGSGITAVVGPNASGKTNLLEAIYFALVGRSFRTRDRRELIAFGEPMARAQVEVTGDDGSAHTLLGSVSRGEGRRHLLDGSRAEPGTIAEHRPHVVVFSPDSLVLVKGPPSERRAHLDSFLAARWPGRSELRREYGRVLAQRNALLRRIRAGLAPDTELDAWDSALVSAAVPLIAARSEAVGELTSHFAAAAAELGMGREGKLRYAPRCGPSSEALLSGLAERRESDVQRIRTSWGPHLDELEISIDGRSLRRYGSQGQQRAGLLAMLFAEREALMAANSGAPLMLLDDVMSELDPRHRELLAERLAAAGQSLITAADETSVPSAAGAHSLRMPSGLPTPLPVAA